MATARIVRWGASKSARRAKFRFIAIMSRWGTESDKAQWKDGQLVMPNLAPLALPALAATAHARNFVTGAVAHSFSRWGWSRARFPVAGQQWRGDIDALAVRKGSGKFERLDR